MAKKSKSKPDLCGNKLLLTLAAILVLVILVGVNMAGAKKDQVKLNTQDFMVVSPSYWILDASGKNLERVTVHIAYPYRSVTKAGLELTIGGVPAEIDSISSDDRGDLVIKFSPLDDGLVLVRSKAPVEVRVTYNGVLLYSEDGLDVSVDRIVVR